jgi:hypothetical protein
MPKEYRRSDLELVGFRIARVAQAPPEPASLELFVRRAGIALAALSLALTQSTAPDLWFSPGPKILERSA